MAGNDIPVSSNAAPTVANTPVPPQNAPAINPAPSPDSVDDSAGNSTIGQVAGAAPATSSAPTVTKGQNMSAGQHQSFAGKVLQDIAGGQTTDYAQTPNGPVAVKRNLKPGELARTIVGAAFSLLAAGAGGDLAAREKRPYVQPEEQTIGGQQRGIVQQRQQEAEREFQNQQKTAEQVLQAHKDAREQQLYMSQLGKDQDAHREAEQRIAAGDRAAENEAYDRLVRQTMDYNKAIIMPGAEIMKGPDGKELSFATADAAQAYALAHPDIIHGSTDGTTSRYGVVPVTNPWTGQVQFVDYPADRHTSALINVGQKIDKNGNPVVDKNGNPVPDGTILDPKTKKPTVLTETVTADQARDIKSKQITQANTEAEMKDRDAQARLRDAQAAKNQDLMDAIDIYDNGNGINKLTGNQKQIMARYIFQEQTLESRREQEAAAQLAKVKQASNNPDSDPEVTKAQLDYDNARDAYDDYTEKYNALTGNTPGIILGNKILRSGVANLNWANVDKQITDSALSQPEQNVARSRVWNAMSPAQQAAARKTTSQQVPSKPQQGPIVAPPQPGAKIAGNADALSRYMSAAGGDKKRAAELAQRDGWDVSAGNPQ